MKHYLHILIITTILSITYGLYLINNSLEASANTTETIALQGAVRNVDEIHVSNEIITTIPPASELITWYDNLEPDETIINEIQEQLNFIPDKLLLAFVNMQGTIVVIDSTKYYITSNVNFDFNDDWTIEAQTDTYFDYDSPVYSEIMVLNNTEAIQNSICHEFGHILYAILYGQEDFVLEGQKNNTKDYRNYIKELKDTDYISSSNEEYFAEVFANWCKTNEYNKHEDLQQMNTIVTEWIIGS